MWFWKLLIGLVFGIGVSTNSLVEVDRVQKVKANRLDEWVRAQVEMVDLNAPLPSGGLPIIDREIRAGLRSLPAVTAVFPHLYKSDFTVWFPNGNSTTTRLLVTEKGFLKKSGYTSPGEAGIASLAPNQLLTTTQWLAENNMTAADLPLSIQIRSGDRRRDAVIVSSIEMPTIGDRAFDNILIADFHTTELIDQSLLRKAGVSVWASDADTEPVVKEATESYLTEELSLQGSPFKVYMQSGKSIVTPKKERDALVRRIFQAKVFAVSVLVAILVLVGAISRKSLFRKLSLLHDMGFTLKEILLQTVTKPTLTATALVSAGSIAGGIMTAFTMGVASRGVSNMLILDLVSSLFLSAVATIMTVGFVGFTLVWLFSHNGWRHE